MVVVVVVVVVVVGVGAAAVLDAIDSVTDLLFFSFFFVCGII